MPLTHNDQPAQRTKAVTLTDVLAAAATKDCWVEYLAFANTDLDNDIGVTVQDGNGKTLVPGTAMAAGQLTEVPIPEGGVFFSGGLKWKAATAAKIDAWVRLRTAVA